MFISAKNPLFQFFYEKRSIIYSQKSYWAITVSLYEAREFLRNMISCSQFTSLVSLPSPFLIWQSSFLNLATFLAFTRLIWPGVGSIDSPNQSIHIFEQYDSSEVLEKLLMRLFDALFSKKCSFFGIFMACISNFIY